VEVVSLVPRRAASSWLPRNQHPVLKRVFTFASLPVFLFEEFRSSEQMDPGIVYTKCLTAI
jgi:hypothetical protein